VADNVAITAGSGTAIAADDISSVWHQRVKVQHGADGSATDTSAAAPLPVTESTSVSTHHLIAAGSGDATSVKASAAQLRGVHVFNAEAAAISVKFHNTAGAPTPGSGVVLSVRVQAGFARDITFPGNGRAFATGLGMTVVTELADAGSTGVTAGSVEIEVVYV